MNQIVIMSALPAAACLCLSLFMFISGRRHEAGKIHGLLSLDLFLLSLIYLYRHLPVPINHDLHILTALAAGWVFFPPLLLHFSICVSGFSNLIKRIATAVIYLPVAAFLYGGFEPRPFFAGRRTDLAGWTAGGGLNDLWHQVFIIYFSAYCALSLIFLSRVIKRSFKRSGGIISFFSFAGAAPVVGFVSASDVLLPLLTADYFTACALLVIFVWIASLWEVTSECRSGGKSGFSQELLAREILRHGDSPFLIAANDGNIIYAGSLMTGMLGYGDTELEGIDIGKVIVEAEPILNIVAKMRKGVFHTGSSHIQCITRDGLKIAWTINCTLIDVATKGSPGFIIAGPRYISWQVESGRQDQASDPCGTTTAEKPGTDAANHHDANEIPGIAACGGNGDAGFRSLVENALVGMFAVRDGRLVYANRGLADMFGYQQDDISGSMDFIELANVEDRSDVAARMEKSMLAGNRSAHFTFSGRRRDGVILDIEARCTEGEFAGEKAVIGSLYEITELKMMEEAMRHEALHDPLTSLPNRVLFSDRVDMAIAKADREKTMLALMFLDLDRFKGINDAFGHNVGDMLLQSAAGVLRGCLRDSDSVARLGGDEFTILLSSIKHEEDAIMVARKILSAVNQHWILAGQNVRITTSVGISIFPDDGLDSETLIRKADTAMYSAKAHGGNTFRLYAPFMDAGSTEQMRMENDLRMALDKKELFIQYQPQFDMATRKISGVEALLRWNHPEFGIILPENFIPIAEKTGLIVPIGEWVLTTACVQAVKWRDNGHSSLNLAVNVSGIQLKETDFTDMVERVLKESSLESNCLKLEITESVALQNLDAIVPKLAKLREMGVQFAIDDFGMGYSSLHYLKRLPIQTIKIDRSFMRDLAKGEEDASIVMAVIAMAKSLNLDTIAEGVETSEQMVFLNKCRCDKMQGFLYSKPLSPDALESLL